MFLTCPIWSPPSISHGKKWLSFAWATSSAGPLPWKASGKECGQRKSQNENETTLEMQKGRGKATAGTALWYFMLGSIFLFISIFCCYSIMFCPSKLYVLISHLSGRVFLLPFPRFGTTHRMAAELSGQVSCCNLYHFCCSVLGRKNAMLGFRLIKFSAKNCFESK